MKRKGPKVINVGKKDKKDFDLLTKDKGSFFYGRDHKEVFIMAMVYGFLNNSYKTLGEKHSGGHFRVDTMNERDITLIKALSSSFPVTEAVPAPYSGEQTKMTERPNIVR